MRRKNKHICNSTTEGNEIIYTCILCPDFERRFNVITGKMTAKGVTPDIDHAGNHNGHYLGSYNPN